MQPVEKQKPDSGPAYHREGQQSANQGKIEPTPLTEKAVANSKIRGITGHHGQPTPQVFGMQYLILVTACQRVVSVYPHQKN